MAAKHSSHIRSSSFPSSTHPFTAQVEEQLKQLRSTEGDCSALAVCQKSEALKVLYSSMDDWLQLSLTQQALSHESQRQDINDLLDGSLTTIDFGGTVRDVLSQMKETIQQLESSLRRKGGDSADEISTYFALRKKMNKVIWKSLRSMEKNNASSRFANGDAAISMAREVEQISVSVFKSVISFLLSPNARSNRWSTLVSKVLSSKRINCNDPKEVYDLEVELLGLKSDNVRVCAVLKQLEALESTIQEIEAAMECVFRGLVKSRVSLLNILNH